MILATRYGNTLDKHADRLRSAGLVAGLVSVLFAGSQPVLAQDATHRHTEIDPFAGQAATPSAGEPAGKPPLWDNLGTLTFPVTTSNAEAQRYFDQGLRLAYGFNHAEAARAFRTAQQLDPACALCHWGEALVLGPNINAPMDPAAVPVALDALARAKAASGQATEKEQALIEALEARYAGDPAANRAVLDAAYADAMGRVAARFPNDLEIAVLYAEALMDLSPWDYWQPGGQQPKGRAGEIVATLERVLDRNPDHPGAIHYYIHAVEASAKPERAEPHADRLGALMPGAGHLVHMPSHIYYRVGRYRNSLAANEAAVAADEAYLADIAASGLYPDAYYPHNIHFLLASAQSAGDGETAVRAAEKLAQTVSDRAAETIPWVQPIKAAPLFAHAQFSDPATILALPKPGGALPYVEAMWHYGRGVAHAAQGDTAAAKAEAEAIATLGRDADFTLLTQGGVPAQDLLQLARHVVLARIAQSQNDLATATAEFKAAAELEDRLNYMEPPFWYYPVQQSLGATLLLAGDAAGAEAAFRASLERAPNNAWALFGLMEAQKARGDQAAAAETAASFDRAWVGDRQMLDLGRL